MQGFTLATTNKAYALFSVLVIAFRVDTLAMLTSAEYTLSETRKFASVNETDNKPNGSCRAVALSVEWQDTESKGLTHAPLTQGENYGILYYEN